MFGWGRNGILGTLTRRGILVIGVALALASCTVAANPSASGGALTTESAPPTTKPTATPEPSRSASATVAPSPGLAATPTPAPSIAPRPEGEWTGLRWPDATTSTAPDGTPDVQFRVFGTATGYLGFRSLGGTGEASLVAETSTDGITWTSGQTLELPKVDGVAYGLQVGQVIVGPGAMLATGYAGATCGPSVLSGLWRSTDGRSWKLIDIAKTFGADSSVRSIDGGSAGYIATGFTNGGKTNRIWTSLDGLSWASSGLPVAAGKVVADGGTAFSGGYVLAGTVVGGEGCGAGPVVTPSLWWSSDGKAWSRDKLPNAPAGSEATTMICRIDDSALMAVAYTYNEKTQENRQLAWVSRDGRAWSPIEAPGGCSVFSDGKRGILAAGSSSDPNAEHFSVLGKDGKLHELRQTGKAPAAFFASGLWTAALGPTGLVVADSAGTQFILAVPTAG